MSHAPPLDAAAPTRTSGLAIASLVLGILSCPFSVLTGIPGLICAILGLVGISRSEKTGASQRLTGRGLAISGLVLSVVTSALAPALLLPAIMAVREAARAALVMNNLQQVMLAMLTVEEKTGVLPAAIVDKSNKPLLSWRVAILPFLGDEEAKLFQEFHLDEPWDSDHNKSLIPRMPAVYASPGKPTGDGLTEVVAPSAEGTVFGDITTVKSITDDESAGIAGIEMSSIQDGFSTTVLVMSVPKLPVCWTKPVDCGGEPAELFARLERDGVSSIVLGYCDGHVNRVSTSLEPGGVRGIFTRDAGEIVTEHGW